MIVSESHENTLTLICVVYFFINHASKRSAGIKLFEHLAGSLRVIDTFGKLDRRIRTWKVTLLCWAYQRKARQLEAMNKYDFLSEPAPGFTGVILLCFFYTFAIRFR